MAITTLPQAARRGAHASASNVRDAASVTGRAAVRILIIIVAAA
jgi:hypothetical protein